MAEAPLVSVIMPVYNRAEFVASAIESVLEQKYKAVELIVIDNGSTDETLEIISRYEPHVCLLHESKRGPYPSRNRGLQDARGEYVAFIDSDDRWLPEKLSLQVPVLESHLNVSLVHTNGYVFDQYHRPARLVSSLSVGENLPPSGNVFEALVTRNFIVNSTVLTRRACFERYGLFREQEFLAADYHKWLQIASGGEVVFLDQALIKYYFHRGNISANPLFNRWAMISHIDDLIESVEEPEQKHLLNRQRIYLELDLAVHYLRRGLRSLVRGFQGIPLVENPPGFLGRNRLLLQALSSRLPLLRELGLRKALFFDEANDKPAFTTRDIQ